MTDEERDRKIKDLHERLLDPDDGVFARMNRFTHEMRESRTAFAQHTRDDAEAFKSVEKKIVELGEKQSKTRGWILGVLAALGLGGGAAGSKIAEWLGQ
jgi:hypothetical protein